MLGILLLAGVTILYAGYNLFIKVSGEQVPDDATTTIVATICIQLAALFTSVVFLASLAIKGGHVFSLSPASYLWAILAGVCIGGAEIGYLYLFSGISLAKPMAASLAIPTIVSGTIVITLFFSFIVLKESIAWTQILGSTLIILGIVVLFMKERTTIIGT